MPTNRRATQTPVPPAPRRAGAGSGRRLCPNHVEARPGRRGGQRVREPRADGGGSARGVRVRPGGGVGRTQGEAGRRAEAGSLRSPGEALRHLRRLRHLRQTGQMRHSRPTAAQVARLAQMAQPAQMAHSRPTARGTPPPFCSGVAPVQPRCSRGSLSEPAGRRAASGGTGGRPGGPAASEGRTEPQRGSGGGSARVRACTRGRRCLRTPARRGAGAVPGPYPVRTRSVPGPYPSDGPACVGLHLGRPGRDGPCNHGRLGARHPEPET